MIAKIKSWIKGLLKPKSLYDQAEEQRNKRLEEHKAKKEAAYRSVNLAYKEIQDLLNQFGMVYRCTTQEEWQKEQEEQKVGCSSEILPGARPDSSIIVVDLHPATSFKHVVYIVFLVEYYGDTTVYMHSPDRHVLFKRDYPLIRSNKDKIKEWLTCRVEDAICLEGRLHE